MPRSRRLRGILFGRRSTWQGREKCAISNNAFEAPQGSFVAWRSFQGVPSWPIANSAATGKRRSPRRTRRLHRSPSSRLPMSSRNWSASRTRARTGRNDGRRNARRLETFGHVQVRFVRPIEFVSVVLDRLPDIAQYRFQFVGRQHLMVRSRARERDIACRAVAPVPAVEAMHDIAEAS